MTAATTTDAAPSIAELEAEESGIPVPPPGDDSWKPVDPERDELDRYYARGQATNAALEAWDAYTSASRAAYAAARDAYREDLDAVRQRLRKIEDRLTRETYRTQNAAFDAAQDAARGKDPAVFGKPLTWQEVAQVLKEAGYTHGKRARHSRYSDTGDFTVRYTADYRSQHGDDHYEVAVKPALPWSTTPAALEAHKRKVDSMTEALERYGYDVYRVYGEIRVRRVHVPRGPRIPQESREDA